MKALKFILFMVSIPFLTMPTAIALTNYPEVTQTQVFIEAWWMMAIGVVLLGLSMLIQKTRQ